MDVSYSSLTSWNSSDTRDQQPITMTRMKTQICYDFTKGNCFRGEDCRYSHDVCHIERVNQTRNKGICFEHLRGACQRGRLCKFNHDLSTLTKGDQPTDTAGIKLKAGICFDFVRGACCRGDGCPYSHSLAMISQLGPFHRRMDPVAPPPSATTALSTWIDQSQLMKNEYQQQQQAVAYSISDQMQLVHNPPPPPLLSATSSGSESHVSISPTFSLDQIKAIWEKF